MYDASNKMDPMEPKSFAEAVNSPFHDEWKQAMNAEYRALMLNETWVLVPCTSDMKILENKWVYHVKHNEDGTIEKYKARLVIKSFLREQGIDYNEIFAPVVRFESLRFLLAFAAMHDYEIDQTDVITDFLNGPIDVDVYMVQNFLKDMPIKTRNIM